jgi:hypothetical protein
MANEKSWCPISCKGSGAVEDRSRESLVWKVCLSLMQSGTAIHIPHDVAFDSVSVLVISDQSDLRRRSMNTIPSLWSHCTHSVSSLTQIGESVCDNFELGLVDSGVPVRGPVDQTVLGVEGGSGAMNIHGQCD